MRRADADRRGTEKGERGPFVPSFLAYRSRGPGRTILLDLCARAIARSSRGPSTEGYERRRDRAFVRENHPARGARAAALTLLLSLARLPSRSAFGMLRYAEAGELNRHKLPARGRRSLPYAPLDHARWIIKESVTRMAPEEGGGEVRRRLSMVA